MKYENYYDYAFMEYVHKSNCKSNIEHSDFKTIFYTLTLNYDNNQHLNSNYNVKI